MPRLNRRREQTREQVANKTPKNNCKYQLTPALQVVDKQRRARVNQFSETKGRTFDSSRAHLKQNTLDTFEFPRILHRDRKERKTTSAQQRLKIETRRVRLEFVSEAEARKVGMNGGVLNEVNHPEVMVAKSETTISKVDNLIRFHSNTPAGCRTLYSDESIRS
jgi:hypothetical protein